MRILGFILLLLLAVVALPPAWFMMFPEPVRELPPPGVRVTVAPDVAVNALDQGSGPAIVFVHGLPGSGYDWRELTPLLNEAGFRTIAYDRVGYGHSDPRKTGPYSMSANTSELLSLLDALDLNDATVVGWSYGGAMTMNAAGAERIGRIVLVGTGGPDSDDATPPEPNMVGRIIFSKPFSTWRRYVPPVTRFLQTSGSEAAFSGQAQPDWWLEDLGANFTRPETIETYRQEILAPIEPGGFDPREIETPTLILHGDDDRLAPPSIGRYLAEKIPNNIYVEIENGSHMLPVTHAPQLAQEIADFISQDLAPVENADPVDQIEIPEMPQVEASDDAEGIE